MNKEIKTITADSLTKMAWRTQIIYDEAQRLLSGAKDRLIINIGVVGDILKKFSENGFNIIGADFDASITGQEMFDGVIVEDGKKTLSLLERADLAVITGMAITTETIDEILECSLKNGVKTIVFAETGANLAGYYVNNGVDVYLSEHFPFYIFNGFSQIDVCRGL